MTASYITSKVNSVCVNLELNLEKQLFPDPWLFLGAFTNYLSSWRKRCSSSTGSKKEKIIIWVKYYDPSASVEIIILQKLTELGINSLVNAIDFTVIFLSENNKAIVWSVLLILMTRVLYCQCGDVTTSDAISSIVKIFQFLLILTSFNSLS